MSTTVPDKTLPQPTTDLAQCRADLDVHGYCLLADAIPPEQLEASRTRLEEQAEAELQRGLATIMGGEIGAGETGTEGARQLIRSLLNKGQPFRDLMVAEAPVSLFRYLLGREMYCLSVTGLVMRTGAAAQVVHADQIYVPCQTPVPFVANVLYMVSDFTDENGGTRVVPGSHLYDRYPRIRVEVTDSGLSITDNDEEFDTVAVEGPAGTAFIFDGRLWHGAGENRGADPRLAVSIYYGQGFMRQQDLLPMNLTDEAYEAMTDEQRAMAGFGWQMRLGRIEPALGRPSTEQVWPVITELRP